MRKYTKDIRSLPLSIRKEWAEELVRADGVGGQIYLYDPDAGTFCPLGILAVLRGVPLNKIANDIEINWLDLGLSKPNGPNGTFEFDPLIISSENQEFAQSLPWPAGYDPDLPCVRLDIANDSLGVNKNHVYDPSVFLTIARLIHEPTVDKTLAELHRYSPATGE